MAQIKTATMDDFEVKPVRLLAYGGAGAGKTRLGALFPKPFYFDFENGLITLKRLGVKDVHFLPHPGSPPLTFDQVNMVLLQMLMTPEQFGETVVIDTLNALEDQTLNASLTVAGKSPKLVPEQQDYRYVHNKMQSLITDLCKLQMNVVLLASERMIKNRAGNLERIQPDFIGQTATIVPRAMDEVWYLRDEGLGIYKLSTQSDGIAYAKSRYGIIGGTKYDLIVKDLLAATGWSPSKGGDKTLKEVG